MEVQITALHGQLEPHPPQEIYSQPSEKAKITTASLELLPYDILRSILRFLNELPEEPYFRNKLDSLRKRGHLAHPLSNLSVANKHMRDACLPILYEEIIVKGNVSQVLKRFGEVRDLSLGKQRYIKSLHIRCIHSHGFYGFGRSIKSTFDLLDGLTKFENLERLEINCDNYSEYVCTARDLHLMKFQGKSLPRVHTLHMSPYNPHLWNMCPNVRSLSSADCLKCSFDVAVAAHMPLTFTDNMRPICVNFSKLRHLRMDAVGDFEYLSNLVMAAPQLEILHLTPPFGTVVPLPKWNFKFMRRLVLILAGLKSLQHLKIPQAGPTDSELARGVGDKCQGYLFKNLVAACPSLQDITFDANWKAELLRHNSGRLYMVGWHRGAKEYDIFSDRRKRCYPLLGDSVTAIDGVNGVRRTAWFSLRGISSFLLCGGFKS